MKMYVGVTDYEWFTLLKEQDCDEVNFWTPGGNRNFRALSENEMFLFKLHAPRNYIVGGGFFVRFSILPDYLAWEAFGIKNGVTSRDELETRIRKYKLRNKMDLNNPKIGCSIPGTIDEWLEQFEMFSIYQVLPEIIALWGDNMMTDVAAKKGFAEASGR